MTATTEVPTQYITRGPGILLGDINTISDEEMFSLIDCPKELNEDIAEKQKWPRPKFEVGGRRYLVIQDSEHEKIGSIVVPEESRKRQQSTSGIVVQVGDGYDEDRGCEDWNPPYGVGARIAWGKYNHTEVEIDVDWSWFTAEELERYPEDSRKVKFIILNTHQVFGKLL